MAMTSRVTQLGIQVLHRGHIARVTQGGLQVVVSGASVQTARVSQLGAQVLVSGWTNPALVTQAGINVLIVGTPPTPRPRAVVITAG